MRSTQRSRNQMMVVHQKIMGVLKGGEQDETKDTREKTAAAATEKTSLAGTGLLVFVGERVAEGSWSIQEAVNAAAPADNLRRY
ncbi:unnamed protein product [Sphagnum jensenii]|uniref:Uncharacterized protein n=1 Tax=Sphagnum jensenii TaxID=128206 RepID=A0ABP0W6W7_9BRYO